jgi:hypothetical protein
MRLVQRTMRLGCAPAAAFVSAAQVSTEKQLASEKTIKEWIREGVLPTDANLPANVEMKQAY